MTVEKRSFATVCYVVIPWSRRVQFTSRMRLVRCASMTSPTIGQSARDDRLGWCDDVDVRNNDTRGSILNYIITQAISVASSCADKLLLYTDYIIIHYSQIGPSTRSCTCRVTAGSQCTRQCAERTHLSALFYNAE